VIYRTINTVINRYCLLVINLLSNILYGYLLRWTIFRKLLFALRNILKLVFVTPHSHAKYQTNTNTGTRSGVYVINDEPNFRVLLEISAKRRQGYEISRMEYNLSRLLQREIILILLLLAFRIFKYTNYASIIDFLTVTMYRYVPTPSDCQRIVLK